MNKIPRIIKGIVAVNILFGLLAVGGLARGQMTNSAWLGSLGQELSPLLQATNYSFAPYGTYAENAPQGRRWGGGLFALYNVNNYVGTGLAGDFLGQFTMVSGNVTLKMPVQPFSSLAPTNSFFHSITVTPLVYGGIGTPLSGSTTAPATITGWGGSIGFGHLWGGQFGIGYTRSHWDNAGIYSGARDHGFLAWSKGF